MIESLWEWKGIENLPQTLISDFLFFFAKLRAKNNFLCLFLRLGWNLYLISYMSWSLDITWSGKTTWFNCKISRLKCSTLDQENNLTNWREVADLPTAGSTTSQVLNTSNHWNINIHFIYIYIYIIMNLEWRVWVILGVFLQWFS